MAKKRSAAHDRYMEKYNKRKWQEKIDEGGHRADPAGTQTFDWETFYTNLYEKHGLQKYLPKVVQELQRAE